MLINFENFKSNLDGLAHIFNIYVVQISITKKLPLYPKNAKYETNIKENMLF